jgi:hypothetical protein
MDRDNSDRQEALKRLTESRRAALKRLIGTGMYVVPLVSSFSMEALSIDGFLHTAEAY